MLLFPIIDATQALDRIDRILHVPQCHFFAVPFPKGMANPEQIQTPVSL
jgi:hypothetical protein